MKSCRGDEVDKPLISVADRVLHTYVTNEGRGAALDPSNISAAVQDEDKLSTATPYVLGFQQLNGTIAESTRLNRKSEIQHGGQQSGSIYNSASRLDSNTISMVTPIFSQSSCLHCYIVYKL